MTGVTMQPYTQTYNGDPARPVRLYLEGIPENSRMARGGSLQPDKLTSSLMDYLNTLQATALGCGETLTTLSLAWVLAQRGVTSVLVGVRTPEQLKEVLRSANTSPHLCCELPLYPHKVF